MSKANEPTEAITQEKVTFFVYNQDNELRRLETCFYSPWNEKTFNQMEPKQPLYNNPVMWTFNNKWEFTTDDPNAIEYFTLLATGLSPVTGTNKLSNGKMFNPDMANRIKMEKPKPKVDTKTITKIVEVQVIPKAFAETLTVDLLRGLCKYWDITLPDFKWGDIKDKIIAELKATGHLK